jgi:hypothetical protein
MNYIIAVGKFDYADEFDCECFWCGPQDEWNKLQDAIKKIMDEIKAKNIAAKTAVNPERYYRSLTKGIGFGTNEDLEFYDFDDVMRKVRAYEISEMEYEFIKKIFCINSEHECFTWGTGSGVFELDNWKDSPIG